MAPGMDELVFRASERLEVVHMQMAAGVTNAKEYILRIQEVIIQAWNNPAFQEALDRAADNARSLAERASEGAREAWQRAGIDDLPSPAELFRNINMLFRDRMWRRTAFIFVCGVACGTVFGITVGCQWGSKVIAIPHSRALHSLEDGTAVMVEDGAGARVRRPTEVVVKIHAFSVDPLDRDILRGRARRLREIFKPANKDVTVGRSFSGVITEMGPAVTRLDIGDEVWGAISEWEGGAAQEYLSASSRRVGRRPRALPPEAAASLPHCGALALHHLHHMGINVHTAKGKRVLIIGAGSGSGCVMLQLLKAWGAFTTAVCDPRARPLVTALGAQEALAVDWCDDDGTGAGREANSALYLALVKDLSAHNDPWDAACICRAPISAPPPYCSKLMALLKPGAAAIADMRPMPLFTDRAASFVTAFYGGYLAIRRGVSWLRGLESNTDFMLPTSLDGDMLDRLSSHVESGNLQTVVDKVYALQDFELALSHACSIGAIGCTVVRMP